MHRLIVTSATYRQSSQAAAGAGPARPGEPPAGPRAAVPPAGRGGPRQRPGDRRAARRAARRAVGQAVPAGRPLGGAGRRGGRGPVRPGQGAEPLPPQPLRLPQADRAAPGHGHLRRPQPRDLPGQAGPDQHAAPGPRAAQRRDLRRGRRHLASDAAEAAHARERIASASAGRPRRPPREAELRRS